MAIPTSRRVGDIFYTACRRTSTTSRKPLTDKPDHKQTSCKDKQTGLEHVPHRTDCFCGSGSRIGIHITLYKPLSPVISHSFYTLKMTGMHQEQLIDHLRVFGVFIEFIFLLYLIFSRHRRQQNPAPARPALPSPPPPPPRKRRKPQNPWVLAWILQREQIGCYRTLLDELITTDIPGYRNFNRMEPAFFDLIEERITPTSGSHSPTSGSHWKSA